MKRLMSILVISFGFMHFANAQTVPQGMKYQAVARDHAGDILANQDIALEINLYSPASDRDTRYSELHTLTTNELGLFTLTIGEGRVQHGSFENIPWSTENIFMSVAIQDRSKKHFKVISDSRLLAVPYAFHAATAGQVLGWGDETRGPGVPAQAWSLFGNSGTDPEVDRLGTTDDADLVIITNDIERLRVTSAGDIEIANNLNVGSNVHIDSNLTVGENVHLNTTGGSTGIHGDLTVLDMSSTHLTGTLDVDKSLNVDGSTHLNDSLTVQNEAPTLLTGELKVLGAAQFGKTVEIAGALYLEDSLSVLNMAPTHLTGKLEVDKNLSVGGTVSVTTESAGHIATFTNTNNNTGDGIKISLGKTHPRWNGAEVKVDIPGVGFLQEVLDATKTAIKGILENPGDFSVDNFVPIGEKIIEEIEDTGQNIEGLANAACNLTNDVIAVVNGTLEGIGTSEVDVGQELLDELNDLDAVSDALIDDEWINDIDDLVVVPGFSIPGIPSLTCPSDVPALSFTMPNIVLSDVANSLDNENQFIQFTDEADRQLGAVRAESVSNWCARYLDLAYFMTVLNSFAGITEISVDPVALGSTVVKYAINGITIFYNATESYNSIGVEYSSGFGDYAEWLEKADQDEEIHTGDIVGVKGGRISKDLTGAEQVMAVSYKPIVLGNTPPKGMEHLGNKVAFMGQIPVKVMGPVQSGDFIVGKGDIPGYGVAIPPTQITADDMALAVGRSWESHPGDGPKMVNTVVGVHNGDYLHVLKSYQAKLDDTDARLSAIEGQLNILFPQMSIEQQ